MLKWIGKEVGIEFVPGLPARNIRDEEVDQYGGEDVFLSTGYYVRETKAGRGPKENKGAVDQPSSEDVSPGG